MSAHSNTRPVIPSESVTCATRPDIPADLRLSPDAAALAAARFKALGHPVRVQIVDILSRYEGEVCVCDIERQFSLTQPTISHHLKVLREAGLVEADQRGLWVYYYILPRGLEVLRDLLQDWQR